MLVLFFVVLANLKLLRNKYFYLAAGVALLLFVPHIVWQVDNGFPSLSYHLYERSAPAYKLRYTLEYPLNQLAVFGPFLLPVMVLAVWKGGKIKTPLAGRCVSCSGDSWLSFS